MHKIELQLKNYVAPKKFNSKRLMLYRQNMQVKTTIFYFFWRSDAQPKSRTLVAILYTPLLYTYIRTYITTNMHSCIMFVKADSWRPSSGCIGKFPRVRICAFFSSPNCLYHVATMLWPKFCWATRRRVISPTACCVFLCVCGRRSSSSASPPSFLACLHILLRQLASCKQQGLSCNLCARLATLWQQQRGITVGAFAIKVNIAAVTPTAATWHCGSVACNLNSNKSASAMTKIWIFSLQCQLLAETAHFASFSLALFVASAHGRGTYHWPAANTKCILISLATIFHFLVDFCSRFLCFFSVLFLLVAIFIVINIYTTGVQHLKF